MILNGQDSLSFIAVFILAGFILALIATMVSVISIPMASHKRKDTLTAAVIITILLLVWTRLMSFFYGLFFNQTELINAGWSSLLGNENFLPFAITFVISGFLLATLVFSISIVTVPLLFHRNTRIMTAMATSVRVVKVNPATMMRWGCYHCLFDYCGNGLIFHWISDYITAYWSCKLACVSRFNRGLIFSFYSIAYCYTIRESPITYSSLIGDSLNV